MDRFVTVTQGELFYTTQLLAELEGLERGPAGNTSLAAACVIAQQLDQAQSVVVQETEYTGAGKHPLAQLDLARRMGIDIRRGDPRQSTPGQSILIPEQPSQLAVVDIDLEHVRRSYLQHAFESLPQGESLSDIDLAFLADETRISPTRVQEILNELTGKTG
jgi:threonine synthase